MELPVRYKVLVKSRIVATDDIRTIATDKTRKQARDLVARIHSLKPGQFDTKVVALGGFEDQSKRDEPNPLFGLASDR